MYQSTIQENISAFASGDLLRRIEMHQKKIVSAVQDTGKVGELHIKIKYKQENSEEIKITSEVISHKVPERALETTIMYPLPDNRLSTQNPRQMDIEDNNVSNIGQKQADLMK